MNCEELNGLLDQWLDGELTDEQRRSMQAHGAQCPECAAAIRSAEQLKALFDGMEPEVDVPLQAQAAWRGAIREESRRRGRSRAVRWIASAAAAVVVLVGVGVALNLRGAPVQKLDAAMPVVEEAAGEAPEREEAEEIAYEAAEAPKANAAAKSYAMETAREAGDYDAAVVETDGAVLAAGESLEEETAEAESASEAASFAAATPRAPACELSLAVEDVNTACERIRDLVEEYEGAADVQPLAEGGANVYVEINANNAGDFISAVMPLDTSGQSHELPEFPDEGVVLVLLAVKG